MIALAMLLAAAAAPASGAGPTRARALEPMANWISDRDYPADAIRREAQGATRFRLVIDERGNVESCEVTESSHDASLDAATCSIMSIRGRFEPARDAEGHAVKDVVESRVRWVLPDEMPPTLPFEPVRLVTSLHVTADGEVSCSTNASDDPDESVSGECGMFAGSGVTQPMRAAHADTTLTAILTIVPQGAPAPPGGTVDYGRAITEAEAALSIAADGRVAACRAVRFQVFVPMRAMPAGGDLCASYPVGGPPMFAAAPAPDQLRFVHITETAYVRGGPPLP